MLIIAIDFLVVIIYSMYFIAFRSTVIIEGGIHGREWISPTFVTYMINAIVNSKDSQDKTLKEVARTYEWYFVPVLNPDGYEYTYNSVSTIITYSSLPRRRQYVLNWT